MANVARHSEARVHGEWFVRPTASDGLRAFHIQGEAQLDLTGQLSSPTELERLSAVSGELGSLARSIAEPPVAPTIERLLAPRGWGLLFLELTGRCNERCVHCYASAAPEVEEALDWPTIERALIDARALGFSTVQLTGGDPLLSPHLLRAARLSHELGLKVEVYTNGLALRDELARELAELGVKLALSFYSYDPVVHDAVTGTPGSQERTLRAILLGIRLAMPVRVAIIATEASGVEVDRTRAYLIERGVPEQAVGASREMSVGRGSFREDQPAFEWGRTHGSSDRRLGKLCVTYQGRVVPCVFDRTTVLGDIRGEGLVRVASRDVNELNLPKRLRSADLELSCGDCRFRRSLLGG